MKKSDSIRILALVAVVFLVPAAIYELAYRYVTASQGEVDLEVAPPRVYYSYDLVSTYEWRRSLFGFRTQMPLGKVRLAKGTGLHVGGGRFHRRLDNGSWQDLTDVMIEYHHKKRERTPSIEQPSIEQPIGIGPALAGRPPHTTTRTGP